MKCHLTIILIILWTATFGQSNFLKINNVSEDEDFNFPIFLSKNKLVDEKINVHLQLSELDLIIGNEKKIYLK